MPAFAGFYVSYEECRRWLLDHKPEYYHESESFGAGPVSRALKELLAKHSKRRIVQTRFLPPPIPYDVREAPESGLMIIRRCSSEKKYMHPSPNPVGFDATGKALLKEHLDLNVSDWIVMWYNEGDGWYRTTLLEPEPEVERVRDELQRLSI